MPKSRALRRRRTRGSAGQCQAGVAHAITVDHTWITSLGTGIVSSTPSPGAATCARRLARRTHTTVDHTSMTQVLAGRPPGRRTGSLDASATRALSLLTRSSADERMGELELDMQWSQARGRSSCSDDAGQLLGKRRIRHVCTDHCREEFGCLAYPGMTHARRCARRSVREAIGQLR